MKNLKSNTEKKKSGIKRAFIGVILILIVLIAAVLVCVLTRLDAIVKGAIEKYGSLAAGTAVRVESVKIHLREGTGAIRGLTLANPEGFNGALAFSLGVSEVGIDIRSLAHEVKIINEIIVRGPEILVEINSANVVNMNIIRKNLEKSASPRKSPTGKKDKTGPEPRMIIRRIVFSEGSIQARIASLNDKTYQLKLPAIEMKNIGGKNGATPDELTRQILDELCRRAVYEVERKIGAFAAERMHDAVKSKLSPENIGRLLR